MPIEKMTGAIILLTALTILVLERGWLLRNNWLWKKRDYLLSAVGFLGQSISSRVMGLAIGALVAWSFPGQQGTLADTPLWLAFCGIWAVEEFIFYWLHRMAHEGRFYSKLWKLHRAHHSGTQFGILLAFRYNFWWPFLRPQTWVAAFALYFGMLEAYLIYLVMTFVVGIYTHIPWRWDLPLYRIGWLKPIVWVVERILVLPDAHHAHHGLGKHGRIRSNYATSLMIWDVLFGTAYFPHARQERVGLNREFDLKEEMFWPVVRQKS